MSSLTLSMKMSPKDTGRLFSKACRLEDENKQLRARAADLKQQSVPDAECIRALQDACDIIQADANTEENYASLCRIGAVLVKLRPAPTEADEWKKPTDDWPAHSEPVMGWNPYWADAGNETGIRECFRNAAGDEWLSAVFQEGDDYYQTGDDRPRLCRAYPEPPKEQDDE